MTYRVRNLTIAIVLAALAAALVSVYVANYRRDVQRGQGDVGVLVAAHDIPVGTPGSQVVAGHMLTTRVVPRQAVVPGAVSSPAQIAQLVVTQPLYAGDQVTSRRFGPVGEQGIQGQLTGTLRALQVPGDGNQLLAGTLKAGDRVDVVASIHYTDASAQAGSSTTDRIASRIVLRNIDVLQAPGTTAGDSKLGGAASNLSVLLAVTDSQAQKLFYVMRNGDWSLELRPALDAADSPDGIETAQSVLGAGLPAGEQASLHLTRSGR